MQVLLISGYGRCLGCLAVNIMSGFGGRCGLSVTPCWYLGSVTEPRKIWTAEELESMTPAERKAIFDDGIVWNLDDAPQELVDSSRQKVLESIEETERSAR